MIHNLIQNVKLCYYSTNPKENSGMNLRRKIFVVIILAWGIIIFFITLISYALILTDYSDIEKHAVSDQYNRLVETLTRSRESLNALVVDWARWDDTYQFLKNKNKKYIEGNLQALTTYKELKMNFVLFFDNHNNYFYGMGYNLNTDQFMKVPDDLIKEIIDNKNYILRHGSIKEFSNGILLTKGGYVMFSSYPITDSKSEAKPNGNIVMAYYIDRKRIELLSRTLGVYIDLLPLNKVTNRKVIDALNNKIDYYAIPKNKEVMEIYFYLNDISFKPIGVLYMEMPRRIYAQGVKTIKNYLLILGIFGVLIVIIVELIMKYFILNRLESYKDQLANIADTQNFTTKILIKGHDEITNMAMGSNSLLGVINDIQQKLEKNIEELREKNNRLNTEISGHEKEKMKVAELNKELLSTARLSGMAEVATSVLHNIGNILNSVNVSSQLLYQILINSKILEGLREINKVLNNHNEEIYQSLQKTKFGKGLLDYLVLLEESLTNEKTQAKAELSTIIDHVQHIREVVMAQQVYGVKYGLLENVSLEEQINLAVNIVGFDSTFHITRKFDYQQVLSIDKSKLMQVLVNLIRNAKDSLLESKKDDKKIDLIVKEFSSTQICLEIIDNGIGIDKKNLDKIFTFGFTTKKKGHGYGLHSSALLVVELGGKISVESDGAGHGAKFIILLPKKPS